MERWQPLPPLNTDDVDSILKNPLNGRIVLLIEDDEALLKIFSTTFAQQGAHVLTATDPETAMRLIRTLSPGLIVTDIDFSGKKTGLEFVAFLAEEQSLKEIPLIVLSGCDDHSTRTQALLLGALDYVRKPCTPSQLLHRIRAVL